ncbi:MAG: DNA-J related domain-containing protein [Desulfobacterales bacterium]
MDEFSRQLALLDTEKIRSHLLSLRSPCYESEVMGIAFPELRIQDASPLMLYRSHFLLFHLLYRLQEDFYSEGKYLFIHFMRIFLTDYPEPGMCRFYDEHTGIFCKARCGRQENYCAFHLPKMENYALDELSAKYFYLDTENFWRLDEKSAGAFMEGAWEMLNHYEDYEKSLQVLGICGTPDREEVKRKFRELAKKHHPDKGSVSHEKFYEINRAYRLLLRVMPDRCV